MSERLRRQPREAVPSPARALREQGRRAKKALGQHFLRDRSVLQKSIAAAELTPDSVVLEVGPGLGALTAELARVAGQVVAVEFDEGLAERLRGQFRDHHRIHILTGNILARPPEDWLREGLGLPADAPVPPYTVVANLPYNIASAVLRRMLGAAQRPQRLVVMVQREVANAICAAPGAMTPLSVSVQLYGAPRIVATVPPGAFFPPPKVDSAIVRIDVVPAPGHRVAVPSESVFFRVVRACFIGKRKQLRNSLRSNLVLPDATVKAMLEQAGIAPDRRPQTLSLEEWAALARAYAPYWQPASAEPAVEMDDDHM